MDRAFSTFLAIFLMAVFGIIAFAPIMQAWYFRATKHSICPDCREEYFI